MSPLQAMERSYATLKRMLREGRYAPGARLEANRLAEELGVSMTPVRDVLQRLVGEHLVEASAGEGFHVPRLPKRKRSFATLLLHMVEVDGLTEAQVPMWVRCGGGGIGQLTGDNHPSLAERRNLLAHGDPFDGFPTGGLLELVRDLINYAYRSYIAEAAALGRPG